MFEAEKAAVTALVPDAVFSETDYGHTIGVTRPGLRQAVYLRRVYRPERDGFFDVRVWRPEAVAAALEGGQ